MTNTVSLFRWTPNGRKQEGATAAQFRDEAVHQMSIMVRETGYHVAQLIAANAPKDDCWSRSVSLYQQACDGLRMLAGAQVADTFIRQTYQPDGVFLHCD